MKLNLKIKYSKEKILNFELLVARSLNLKKKQVNTHVINERNYDKVFCIGFNKTGTTSLEGALKNFGFRMGNQPVAEMLVEDWANKRTDRIINYCYTADAFQDVPFSLPELYKELDKAFPNSKFILTIRDNEEQWYNSLTKFHTKLFSSDKNNIPTEDDLRNAIYRYKGFALNTKRWFYDYPNTPLYDKKYYTEVYLNHIKEVKKYFKNRKDKLLILNVAEKDSYQRLAHFLNVTVDPDATFPWLNKT